MEFEIREVEGKKGLYAVKRLFKGYCVASLLGPYVTGQRTRTSIQLENGLHSEHPWAQYMNHSFEPNCAVLGKEVITLRIVEPGEELTFNYEWNEDHISSPFIDEKTGRWVGSPTTTSPFREGVRILARPENFSDVILAQQEEE